MSARSFLRLVAPKLAAAAAVVALGLVPSSGCSLGNVAQDDCSTNTQCQAAFGLGSKCSEGFCTAPPTCETGHDCRIKAGGGVCMAGKCVDKFPKDDTCPITEPPDLLDQPAAGDDAPLVIGSIFSVDSSNDGFLIKAARLAVQEINERGGMANGRKVGMVVCDNGGPKNEAKDDARIPLNNHALDYLAGTLGTPAIVGPLSSADSIKLVNRLMEKKYPSVIISPSATSPDLTGITDRLDPKDPYGLFWRTCPSDEFQGQVLAKDVIPANEKVSVIYLNDAYGEGLANVFNKNRTMAGKAHLIPYDDPSFADAQKLHDLVATAAADDNPAVLIIALHADEAVKILTEVATSQPALALKQFYFTDGSKDAKVLLDPNLPQGVKDIVKLSIGTAPASPGGPNYDLFDTNLQAAFGIPASSFSFLAQSYDAAYVAAYGIVFASKDGNDYDGRGVAAGMANLISGKLVNIAPTDWQSGKGTLIDTGTIDVEGTSGHLQFDPSTGEAPGRIEVWGVDPNDATKFVTNDVLPH